MVRAELIDHERECPGMWRLTGGLTPIADRRIQCDTCRATYAATPDNRLAAIDENIAGIYLRQLTREGQGKL